MRCQPHTLKGDLANFFPWGSILTSQIEFSCHGADNLQLEGEASVLAEFELQCPLNVRSIPKTSVTLQYYDWVSDSCAESFEYTDGMYNGLDEYTNACLSHGVHEDRCSLPVSSSSQIKDIPPTAIQDADAHSQSPIDGSDTDEIADHGSPEQPNTKGPAASEQTITTGRSHTSCVGHPLESSAAYMSHCVFFVS